MQHTLALEGPVLKSWKQLTLNEDAHAQELPMINAHNWMDWHLTLIDGEVMVSLLFQ
jgi:hypothetical protein